MKKLCALAAIFALVFAACEDEPEQTITQLIIKNESRTRISHAAWNGFEFNVRNPGGGIATYNYYIDVGGSMTGNVQPGTGYIYFRKVISNNPLSYISARTSEPVTLDAGEQKIFTFTDNTVVVNLEANNTGTLGDLY